MRLRSVLEVTSRPIGLLMPNYLLPGRFVDKTAGLRQQRQLRHEILTRGQAGSSGASGKCGWLRLAGVNFAFCRCGCYGYVRCDWVKSLHGKG